ncbi:MAG: hypothetical protein AAF108_06905 [Planctomycetota bacterium]
MSRAAVGVLAGGLLIGGWLGWSKWFVPRGEVREQIETFEENAGLWAESLKQRRPIEDALQTFGGRMLGGEEDLVRHRLRLLLGDIAGGLSGVVVDDRSARPITNPAVEARATEFRSMRGSLDALEMRATLVGTGPLGDVLGVLASVQSQPWVHGIGAVTLRRSGSEGEELELRVELVTLFAPDLFDKKVVDAEAGTVGVSPTTDRAFAAVARLMTESRFFPPSTATPAVVDASPTPAPVTPPPARVDPRTMWRIVGLTRAAEGERVLLRHESTGESRVLAPGQSIHGLEFRAKRRGEAIFQEAGSAVVVPLSSTLSQARADEVSPPEARGGSAGSGIGSGGSGGAGG